MFPAVVENVEVAFPIKFNAWFVPGWIVKALVAGPVIVFALPKNVRFPVGEN